MTALVPALVALALAADPEPPVDLTLRPPAMTEPSPLAGPSLLELRERRESGRRMLTLAGAGLAASGLLAYVDEGAKVPKFRSTAVQLGALSLAVAAYGASLLSTDPPRPPPPAPRQAEPAAPPVPDLQPRVPPPVEQPSAADRLHFEEAHRTAVREERRANGKRELLVGLLVMAGGTAGVALGTRGERSSDLGTAVYGLMAKYFGYLGLAAGGVVTLHGLAQMSEDEPALRPRGATP